MLEKSNDNSNKKARLGRGLGSLLGENQTQQSSSPLPAQTNQNQETQPKAGATAGSAQAAPTPVATPQPPVDKSARIWKVGIEKLSAGQFQPRSEFKKEALEELSQSIKESGIIQPILVREKSGGKFEIIAGERRWRAAQLAGLHEVPVIIKELKDLEALEFAIVENVQREDLNPIEEAEAYSRLVKEFNLTQQQVAEKVGKERATVANALRLLQLSPAVFEMVKTGTLSSGHAKVLLAVADAGKQKNLAQQAVTEGLSVRKLEKIVASELIDRSQIVKDKPADQLMDNVTERLMKSLSEELQKKLGTRVNIEYENSKGKLSVFFYSDDQLTQIVDKLRE